MIRTQHRPNQACYHCRRLELKALDTGRVVFWCTRQKRSVPDAIVWRRACRHVLAPEKFEVPEEVGQ